MGYASRSTDVGAEYRSDKEAKRKGGESYETLADLRDAAVKSKYGFATSAEEEVERFAGASRQRAALQKYQGSRGIVAAAPGAQFKGSGAGIMGAGQAGMDTAMALLQQQEKDEATARGLRQEAGRLGFEATEYAGAQGTRSTDEAAAFAGGRKDAEEAIRGNSKWYGDNISKMFSEIGVIVDSVRLESPAAADQLEAYYLTPGGAGYTRIRNMEGMDATEEASHYAV